LKFTSGYLFAWVWNTSFCCFHSVCPFICGFDSLLNNFRWNINSTVKIGLNRMLHQIWNSKVVTRTISIFQIISHPSDIYFCITIRRIFRRMAFTCFDEAVLFKFYFLCIPFRLLQLVIFIYSTNYRVFDFVAIFKLACSWHTAIFPIKSNNLSMKHSNNQVKYFSYIIIVFESSFSTVNTIWQSPYSSILLLFENVIQALNF